MPLQKSAIIQECIYTGTGLTTSFTASIQAYLDKYQWLERPSFFLKGTESGGSANVDAAIQSKVDGTNLVSGVTFTQLTASGSEMKAGSTLFANKDNPAQLTVTFSTTGGTWALALYMCGVIHGSRGA